MLVASKCGDLSATAAIGIVFPNMSLTVGANEKFSAISTEIGLVSIGDFDRLLAPG